MYLSLMSPNKNDFSILINFIKTTKFKAYKYYKRLIMFPTLIAYVFQNINYTKKINKEKMSTEKKYCC